MISGVVKMLKKHKKALKVVGALLTAVGITFIPSAVFAAAGDVASGMSMTDVNSNVTHSLANVSQIIHATSILGGIAFFVAFAFKLKQHKDNPTQVTLGQPLMYLFLAISLASLPWFITTSKHVIYGTNSVSNWDHAQMQSVFGTGVEKS